MEREKLIKRVEICNECGREVSLGSSLFIDRIIDLDDTETRVDNSKPFANGDYICCECDGKKRNYQ